LTGEFAFLGLLLLPFELVVLELELGEVAEAVEESNIKFWQQRAGEAPV